MEHCAIASVLDDEDLVQRIRSGDRGAESILVARYSRGVLSLVRHHAPELAEDVHQETFRAILERLRDRGIEDPSKLDRFILRTAKNILRSIQRQAARHPHIALGDLTIEPVERAPGPLEQVSRAELTRYVRQVIGELGTERDRQILFLFYIAGIDKQQVCERLGLDSIHFNRVLFRARERFRQLLLEGRVVDPADHS